MTTFVTFFIDFPEHLQKKFKKWDYPRIDSKNLKDYIPIQYNCIRKYHPDAKYILITDHKTQFPFKEKGIHIIRTKIDPETPALSKLIAFYRFIKKAPKKSAYAFLDFDILIQKNIDYLFDDPADIFLYHLRAPPPLRSSIILVNKNANENASKFFKSILSNLIKFGEEKKKYAIWRGDRILLNKFFGIRALMEYQRPYAAIRDIKFKFSYQNNYVEGVFFNENVKKIPNFDFIHFGYSNIEDMKTYWEKFLK